MDDGIRGRGHGGLNLRGRPEDAAGIQNCTCNDAQRLQHHPPIRTCQLTLLPQEKQHIIESTAEERIQFLENRRTLLTNSKMPLERKLKNLHERMRLQEAEAKAKAEPEQSQ